MKSTATPTANSSVCSSSLTATCSAMKPPCATPSNSCGVFPIRTRFLLRSTTANSWLADHDRISDTSQLFTDDPRLALRFATVEAATACARLILHIVPDLTVEAYDV